MNQPIERFELQPPVADALLRVGYLAAGAFVLYTAYDTFWIEGEALWHPGALVLSFITYALAGALLLNGLRRPVDLQWHWWILGTVQFIFLAQFGLCLATAKPAASGISDSARLSEFGALLQAAGENPYTWNLQGAYSAYRVSNFFVTPTLDGGYVTSVIYPALLDPDAIHSSNYWRGSQPEDIPYGWGFDWQAAQAPKLKVRYEPEGFAIASLALTPASDAQEWQYAGLSQIIPFPPGNLSFWVYLAGPGEAPTRLDDLTYA